MAFRSQKNSGPAEAGVCGEWAKILSVDELNDIMDATLKEMRRRVLGNEVKIAEHGYIDISHGCVMTVEKVLVLMRKQKSDNDRKKRQKEIDRLRREAMLHGPRRSLQLILPHFGRNNSSVELLLSQNLWMTTSSASVLLKNAAPLRSFALR